jgi:hypothetical protein
MKTSFFSALLLILIFVSAGNTKAMYLMKTEIVTGTVKKMDSNSVTLDNIIRYFSSKENTGKLPFQLNDVITLRYVTESDGTYTYIEAARGRNSLAPAEARVPRKEKRFL